MSEIDDLMRDRYRLGDPDQVSTQDAREVVIAINALTRAVESLLPDSGVWDMR